MASFLIDRHSPMRSGISPTLRHRSRPSESENYTGDNPATSHDDLLSSDKTVGGQNDTTHGNEDMYTVGKRTVKSKSMLSYFMTELTRDYRLEGDASKFVETRARVYTSVHTPYNMEKFCAFGFLQCLDSILYVVTFLPLRIIYAIMRVLTYPCAFIFMGSRQVLDGAQVCDLLKGFILVVSCFLTSYMDMSMIYHIVRGQSIIKFYVFYNMLDVMDKLISGFGQDVLDSLYWTVLEPRGRKREHFGMIFHLLLSIAYVVSHTVMILIQAIILNVAFNSHNKNLLTIMMSNNFVEIKGNLFKRLDKNNLCQITYSDVKERFHYLVLLLFVFIRNMKELQWKWDMAFPIIQDAAIVMMVELIVDWIKHAFITKFNELSACAYGDFAIGLAEDIASSQKKHAFTNFSDQVCRRMGFTPMPLFCLLFMVCTKSFNISGPLSWLLVILFYACVMSTKILNSIILLGWAQRLITERDKTTKSTGTVVNSQVIPKKEDKAAASKTESIPVPPIPVIITSRPTTVSSSVAVNTDPSMSVDSNCIDSFAQLNEDISSQAAHSEKPKCHHGGDHLQKVDSFHDVYLDQAFQNQCQSTTPERDISTITQDPDSSTTTYSARESQHAKLKYSISPIASQTSLGNVQDEQIFHKSQDVMESEVKNLSQTDFQQVYSNQNSPGAPFPFESSKGPDLFRSVSSPVGELGSSKRKHPDSPTHSFDSFFDSPVSSASHPESAISMKANAKPENDLNKNDKEIEKAETESAISLSPVNLIVHAKLQDLCDSPSLSPSSFLVHEDPNTDARLQGCDRITMSSHASPKKVADSNLRDDEFDDDVQSPEGYS